MERYGGQVPRYDRDPLAKGGIGQSTVNLAAKKREKTVKELVFMVGPINL